MRAAVATVTTSGLGRSRSREQDADRVRGLGPLPDPLRGLVQLDVNRGRRGQRVVVPDDFDEASIARGARIGNDYAIRRLLAASRPSESNVNCHWLTPFT